MQTVNFSGNIDDGDGSGAANINVMMVNRSNIDLQYNFSSDANGNYAAAVEPGYYDVYLNGAGYGGVIYSGVIIESDTVFNPKMIQNISGSPVIFGLAYLEGGNVASASGYLVELLTDNGATVLGKTTVDSSGVFNFAICPVGYHQLRISNAGNNPYLVPMPVPDVNVSISIQMLKAATMDKRLASGEEKTQSASKSFTSVCRYLGAAFIFTDGLMVAGSKDYMFTPNLARLNVYTGTSSNPLYSYSIFIDMRPNPFYAMPPSANYIFTDESGDEYSLVAFWPYLHTVNYNSAAPDIVKVYISADPAQDYYWPNTPKCP